MQQPVLKNRPVHGPFRKSAGRASAIGALNSARAGGISWRGCATFASLDSGGPREGRNKQGTWRGKREERVGGACVEGKKKKYRGFARRREGETGQVFIRFSSGRRGVQVGLGGCRQTRRGRPRH